MLCYKNNEYNLPRKTNHRTVFHNAKSRKHSAKNSLRNKRVLVTCGPTWVAIDPVRVVSNRSTGDLGHRIAEELKNAGARVTLLEGPVTDPLQAKKIRIIQFHFFAELKELLNRELRRPFECIIHAAAVSDFKPIKTFSNKLKSHSGGLALKFVPTEKLIQRIKKTAPKSFLVGFKLDADTRKASLIKKARKLIEESNCDWVVANSARQKKYHGFILNKEAKVLGQARSRKQMAKALIKLLKERT